MSGKHSTLSQVKKAIALRAIGLSRAAIADQTGLSESTLARIFRKHGASKGAAIPRLLEETKRQLIESLSNDQSLQLEAAKLMIEDLALNRTLRDKISESLAQLPTNDPNEAAMNLRALNSAASALITAQKAARVAIGADQDRALADELPVLTIVGMTEEQVAEMRYQQNEARKAFEQDELELEMSD